MNEKPRAAVGDRVRVYKNLKNGQWSVQVKVPGKGWRLSTYVDSVVLTDAVPICSESGAARIRRRQEREVVAKIEGTLRSFDTSRNIHVPYRAVRYNPFRGDQFTYEDGSVFQSCRVAYFIPRAACFYSQEGGE
tara:strand:- start:433 stop:834 length:402 start_codon:yes stop_codon:yes gene_type:complete